jgi:hypothetical protein
MWCILLALRKDRKRAKKLGTVNKLIKVLSNELHPALVVRPSCVFEKMGANQKDVTKKVLFTLGVKLGVA